MKKRESGLDLLRIIFATTVIWFHASVFLVRNVQGEYGNLQISIVIVLSALAKAGVNFFLMTSGAFVLSSPSTQDIKPFYTKMWKRLCIPTIVCVIIYTILDLFLTLIFTDSGTVDDFIQRFIKGQSGSHLWYMFVLIGLYLMAPAVQHIKELIGFKAFTITAVVLLVISFCGESTAPHYLEWDPGYIMKCLGIFMIGYSLHEWCAQKRSTARGIVMILAGIGVLIFFYLGNRQGFFQNVIILNGLFGLTQQNLLIVLIGLLFTGGVMSLDIKKDYSKAGSLTYGVYLSHLFVLYICYIVAALMKKVTLNTLVLTIPEFVIIASVVTILSFAGTYLFFRIKR